jgi:hypothetical protein
MRAVARFALLGGAPRRFTPAGLVSVSWERVYEPRAESCRPARGAWAARLPPLACRVDVWRQLI